MLQKTIKHYLMLQVTYGSSLKVCLSYVVHFYLSIMQCELPKEGLHKGETSLATKAYIASSKVILFILSHKNKHPQKVNIAYNM